jgi:hypothetical protein
MLFRCAAEYLDYFGESGKLEPADQPTWAAKDSTNL